MSISALKCFDCGEVIGYYHDSGAPHYHCYVCPCCKDKLEEDEE